MTSHSLDRRRLLTMGGALSLMGAGAPFALQLAASGAASAAGASDYRALVCVFMLGGNDGSNTVLATDSDSWGRYFSARNLGYDPIALMPVGTPKTPIGQNSPLTGRKATPTTPEAWGGVLPIIPATPQPIPLGTSATVRTFALHPFLGPVKSLFDQGRLAVVANVGTLIQPTTKAQYLARSVPIPPSLSSHNDQQSVWQSGGAEGAKVGWGGAMADTLLGSNGANGIFTAISSAGTALFLAGRSADQFVANTGPLPSNAIVASKPGSLFGSRIGVARFTSIIQDTTSTSDFANDYAAVDTRSLNAAATINAAVSDGAAALVAAPPAYVNPVTGASAVNQLAAQLQTVARLIAAGPRLGLRRQVFFVCLDSFDTHSNQNEAQPDLLGQLAQSLAYFDGALANVGGADLRGSVTTFTASEFGRTFTTNGAGTDHAWGSHHFVMGGAVRGGNIYGQYPTLGIDLNGFTNPDMAGNSLVPTTSVDQHGATLGAWLGVAPADLATIFPNLANFSPANLGFV